MGRALALKLGEAGCVMTLAARDHRDLEALAQHIRISYGVNAFTHRIDLEAPFNLNCKIYDAIFITAGVSLARDDADQLGGPDDIAGLIRKIMEVNLLGPAKIALSAFGEFKQRSSPTYIGVCSTIAAPVPRSKNIIYTSAKIALESILQSLQHASAGSNVLIQIFRLGYVDSKLSYGKHLLFPVVSPEQVAKSMILYSRRRSQRLIYLPGYWRYIVFVLKVLPWTLYHRLRF